MGETTRNALWSIAFGDYELTVDRTTLTYRLVETKTGMVWADALPVGWVEIEDKLTGGVSRYDLGQTKLVSLSEKAGAQGKQILFGLDLLGIPIDVYIIGGQREIQITVEANRDTRTHRLMEFCLLPGLCAVPDDGASYLIIPRREGFLVSARNASDSPRFLRIWDANDGVTMPFIGAVRGREEGERSALGIFTDSAYGLFALARQAEDGSATLDTHYSRDPERRRLDMRIVLLPGGDHIAVARAYRDKIIGEQTHVTLRRKLRERPHLDTLLGGALILLHGTGYENVLRTLQIQEPRSAAPSIDRAVVAAEGSREIILLPQIAADLLGGGETGAGSRSTWDDMDSRMDELRQASEEYPLVGATGGCDWSAVALESWQGIVGLEQGTFSSLVYAPLYAAVYHDSVVAPVELHPDHPRRFLRALLNLSPPVFRIVSPEMLDPMTEFGDYARRAYAVLGPLHRLCFPAFLTAHRFLTPDFTVEEARYSNGARVIINQSKTDAFAQDGLALPPLGFYVEHPQMTAYDALGIGQETFPVRAWRIARTRDSKPLPDSADILRLELPV